MKPDTTTKWLLGAIALGLFANALGPILRPLHVEAQSAHEMNRVISALDSITTELRSIRRNGIEVEVEPRFGSTWRVEQR